MINLQTFDSIKNQTDTINQPEIVKFLHRHLEEYGDPEEDIARALRYCLGEDRKPGGLLITARQGTEELAGVCIINKTGMSGYIPENILVYIAIDCNLRGQGLGKKIMQEAISHTEGDIALHCEPENPALHLYQKMGFKSKYLEMRLKK
ncbi:GNAT family N-acetyltransferase [uncultured Chryseobacterium sp.]|uniref:GNAT family N-acetyltransferase n=1 Tax=uncultured Chryseobacterium sp. TaxID=259322 RepID=UPI0025D8E9EB|nr:GNAT family N-acetyltransferase [uncultured Chryseobacterium sp.]